MQYKYTVSTSSGFIQRYPKGSKNIDAFLCPTGRWLINTSYNRTMPQRPISPHVVAYFIAEGGYNDNYFCKPSDS